MQPAIPHQLLDRLTLIIVVLALAAPITYIETAHPSWQTVATALHLHGQDTTEQPDQTTAKPATKAPVQTPAPVATPAPEVTTPAAVTTPAPATPAVKTATTNAFVHLRAAKSVSSPIVTDLEAGTIVELRDDADTSWQGVTYQGKRGYIFKQWLSY